jgi:ligand-binding sensor domain-containing protein
MPELDAFEARFAAAYRRYLHEVPTDVDAAGVARSAAAAHPAGRSGAWPWALRPARAFALFALLALLLVALIATALFAGLQRPALLRNVSLAPTGVEVLTSDPGAYTRMVEDGKGMLWAREDGGLLVRLDPASGATRTWTLSDDAAFVSSDIAPARVGGVWLVKGHTLRLFDGMVFREVIDAPAEVSIVAEAPDAELWAATMDGMVLHWNGSSWSTLDPGRPNPDATISAIAVDAAGRPWIGWYAGGVSRYHGSSWTTFDANSAAPLGQAVSSIVQLPDGALWVATALGLARFDGTSWTDRTPYTLDRATASVAAGPDGTIWVAVGEHNTNGAVRAMSVRRFDGHAWVAYVPADGLPVDAGSFTASVAPTIHATYVGTGAGIYQLANEGWERAWPPDESATNLSPLIAISHDELWARNETGLWHFRNGAWTNDPIDPSRPTDAPTAMALAPDGTLWEAGATGVAYLRDGRWTVVDTGAAYAVAVDARGTVWVAGGTTDQSGAPELWTLRFDGTSWVRRMIAGCPLVDPEWRRPVQTLAIDRNGALWVGIHRGYWTGGLARFDGRSWQAFSELGGAVIDGAVVLGTAPGGAVWVTLEYAFVPTPAEPSQTGPIPFRLARFDGNAPTFVVLPTDYQGTVWAPDPTLAPDGTLWVSTGRGPARYDGQRWEFTFAGLSTAGIEVGPVARDGTLFGRIGLFAGSAIGWQNVVRLPSRATQP